MGRLLAMDERACPLCGLPAVDEEASFCIGCGSRLADVARDVGAEAEEDAERSGVSVTRTADA